MSKLDAPSHLSPTSSPQPSRPKEKAEKKQKEMPNDKSKSRKEVVIAVLTVLAIAIHLILRFGFRSQGDIFSLPIYQLPLLVALIVGGIPLVWDLVIKLVHAEFGSDLLAGISIVTSVLLGEYLAGALVVLMLSGGTALETYAVRSASSVLEALAQRMPSQAHRRQDGQIIEVGIDELAVGDAVVVFPHEICPVDGIVIEGHGVMDESYLTGEPYQMSKTPGSAVLSGAINGATALVLRADKLAVDSRYAKIMEVMRVSEDRRPRLRRIGDQLGAIYTPLAVAIALISWALSGNAVQFLAVLVVATPCPLLIAIPVAIIGSISLSARRGIIIKDPAVLEKIDTCRTAIFDKTGTLTYGEPGLTEIIPASGFTQMELLHLVASLEQYSKHPLAGAILKAAQSQGLKLQEASEISEPPGQGLQGTIQDRSVQITSRRNIVDQQLFVSKDLPPITDGMECLVIIDGCYAGAFRFRDQPRTEGATFVHHLRPKHFFDRVLIVSGDRESEVRYLAEQVCITEIHAGQTPEQKLELVRKETQKANTLFLGDGINDAPALTAATVGIAFGKNNDITAEAAGAVILDTSLAKVDEFFHISRRLRTILLQSAVGGMALSLVGMGFAAAGYLPPVAGAIIQEVIDVLAVVNALRVAIPPKRLTDY
jgi:heavy metal translocating P-type ATPase